MFFAPSEVPVLETAAVMEKKMVPELLVKVEVAVELVVTSVPFQARLGVSRHC